VKTKLFGFELNKKAVIAGLILFTVGIISSCLKVDNDVFWRLYAIIQGQLGSSYQNNELNKKFKNDEKLLKFFITAEVDKALNTYNQQPGNQEQIKLPKPIYSEKLVDTAVCYTEACKSLGGEMRLCAPWVEDCPKNNGI
jgi:hypothetical protein